MLTNNCGIIKLRKQSGRSQSLPEAEASHTPCGQSLLRKGQFRLRRARTSDQEPEKSQFEPRNTATNSQPISHSARPVPIGGEASAASEGFAFASTTSWCQSQLSDEASHASHGQSGINADSLHFFSFRMRKIRPRIMDSILFICSLTSS